jgi:exonuclease VII small subunit
MLDEAEIIVDELQKGNLSTEERIQSWQTLEAILKLMRWEVRDE